MKEKVIFDGKLEAKIHEVQSIIDKFMFDNFISPIDTDLLSIEKKDNRQLWFYIPASKANKSEKKIINGYIDLYQIFMTNEELIHLRVVSCRPELDLLYFQLSQKIQARFLIPNFPSELLSIPWKDLAEEGLIKAEKFSANDIIFEIPNPDDTRKNYGTERNLTKNDVRRFVVSCRAYIDKGGSIAGYYETLGISPPFSLETLRSWLKNPDFAPNPRNKIP